MRRAMRWLGVTLCAAALLPVGLTAAPVKQVNGIGLVDYTRKPDFKVGDWVRYRITGESLTGEKDDYTVTVLIGGEERFWGDDCFWVETWTQPKKGPLMAAATLMSYAIFEDSLPIPRMQLYQRKTINEVSADGVPNQVVLRRSPESLRLRTPFDDQVAMDVDTLGEDTVSVPRGDYTCRKIRIRQGKSTTRDIGDSTEYTEVWDIRTGYYSRKVPITSLVREEIENSFQQRKWQIGRSENAPPLRYLDRGLGEARLMDFGHGLKPLMLTESMQQSLPRPATPGGAPGKGKATPAASRKPG